MPETKEHVLLIHWCEIDGEASTTHSRGENPEQSAEIGHPDELLLPITATEEEIITFLREVNGDEPDGDDGDYYWRQTRFGRTENTATVEFRSGRGHLATTTVVWF